MVAQSRSIVSATAGVPTGGPVPRPARRRVVAAPPPSAEVALEARAREILLARSAGAPSRWLLPGFVRDVDLARRQLGPLRDRRMLVASFERESSRLAALRRLAADPAAPSLPLDPLDAAYALRWIELADGGAPLPGWPELLDSSRAESAAGSERAGR
jgi:hypothetical protein